MVGYLNGNLDRLSMLRRQEESIPAGVLKLRRPRMPYPCAKHHAPQNALSTAPIEVSDPSSLFQMPAMGIPEPSNAGGTNHISRAPPLTPSPPFCT